MATVLLEHGFSLHGARHSSDSEIRPTPQPEFLCPQQGGLPLLPPALLVQGNIVHTAGF